MIIDLSVYDDYISAVAPTDALTGKFLNCLLQNQGLQVKFNLKLIHLILLGR